MNSLISEIKQLKKERISKVIKSRMREFEQVGRDYNSLFRELCYCILTAGTSAELGIKTINHLGDTIFYGTEQEIRKKLGQVYRFHTIRAKFLYMARESFKNINLDDGNVREEVVDKVKGIGMKEASHFLRNIGFKNYAIIDFHIIDVLVRNGLIKRPKTLTGKKYLEIENILKNLANKLGMSLGELDLYLWYLETGKVLK